MTITKTKIRQDEPQSSQSAAGTLAELERKRQALIDRNSELPSIRRGASFAALVEGDTKSRAAFESELEAYDVAISQARNRVLIAEGLEAEAVAKGRAKEALAVLNEFRECGAALDNAFRTIGERSAKLNGLLAQLHQLTGSATPTWQQLDSLGFACLMTAIQSTPWRKRFEAMSPSARRTFAPLFGGWSATIERKLQALLAEPKDEVA